MSGSSSVRTMPMVGQLLDFAVALADVARSALPLHVVGLRLGSLNFASDRSGAFDDWTEQLGEALSAHAG